MLLKLTYLLYLLYVNANRFCNTSFHCRKHRFRCWVGWFVFLIRIHGKRKSRGLLCFRLPPVLKYFNLFLLLSRNVKSIYLEYGPGGPEPSTCRSSPLISSASAPINSPEVKTPKNLIQVKEVILEYWALTLKSEAYIRQYLRQLANTMPTVSTQQIKIL